MAELGIKPGLFDFEPMLLITILYYPHTVSFIYLGGSTTKDI